MNKKGATVKKSLCAILVILLSLVGANALAAKMDNNVQKVATQSTDDAANDNHGGKSCGSNIGK